MQVRAIPRNLQPPPWVALVSSEESCTVQVCLHSLHTATTLDSINVVGTIQRYYLQRLPGKVTIGLGGRLLNSMTYSCEVYNFIQEYNLIRMDGQSTPMSITSLLPYLYVQMHPSFLLQPYHCQRDWLRRNGCGCLKVPSSHTRRCGCGLVCATVCV